MHPSPLHKLVVPMYDYRLTSSMFCREAPNETFSHAKMSPPTPRILHAVSTLFIILFTTCLYWVPNPQGQRVDDLPDAYYS